MTSPALSARERRQHLDDGAIGERHGLGCPFPDWMSVNKEG
jgi:hypothetical protein